MKHNHLSFIITILLISSSLIAVNYLEEAEKHCSDVDFLLLIEDGDVRKKQRADNEPVLFFEYEDIVLAINDSDSSGITSNIKVLIFFIFSILQFLATLTFFIISLCCLCCCKRNDNATKKKAQIYFYLSVVFVVGLIVIFGLMIKASLDMVDGVEQIQCVSAKFPADLVEGSESGVQFIGFKPLKLMLEDFKTEINSLANLSGNFQNIQNQNVPLSSQDALASLPNFESKYSNSQTNSGDGTQSKPLTIQALPETIAIIKVEFEFYNKLAVSINEAATEGQKYSNSAQTQTATSALDTAISELDNIISSVDDFASSIFDVNDQMATTSNIIYLENTIVSCVFVALFITIIVILFCQSYKRKCFGFKLPI